MEELLLQLMEPQGPRDRHECAKHLEERYGRQELIAQIPRVRASGLLTDWQKMILQVALVASLRETGYLMFLARERARPPAWRMRRGRPSAGCAFDHLYRVTEMPRPNGPPRRITVPQLDLRHLQRRLLRHAFEPLEASLVHSSAHGFRRGKSIVSNARLHTEQPLVLNCDIRAFFPSVTFKQVLGCCRQAADGMLSWQAQYFLADICSYKGALPTGAPTSPIIGNMVLATFDKAITTVCRELTETAGLTVYTRYADDITISGPDCREIKHLLPFVRMLLAQRGFRIAEKKTRLCRRSSRQMVTGLVVNEGVKLPRTIRRKLRAAVHQFAQNGPREEGAPMGQVGDVANPNPNNHLIKNEHQLMGWLSFLSSVDPAEAQRYREQLIHALPPDAQ